MSPDQHYPILYARMLVGNQQVEESECGAHWMIYMFNQNSCIIQWSCLPKTPKSLKKTRCLHRNLEHNDSWPQPYPDSQMANSRGRDCIADQAATCKCALVLVVLRKACFWDHVRIQCTETCTSWNSRRALVVLSSWVLLSRARFMRLNFKTISEIWPHPPNYVIDFLRGYRACLVAYRADMLSAS